MDALLVILSSRVFPFRPPVRNRHECEPFIMRANNFNTKNLPPQIPLAISGPASLVSPHNPACRQPPTPSLQPQASRPSSLRPPAPPASGLPPPASNSIPRTTPATPPAPCGNTTPTRFPAHLPTASSPQPPAPSRFPAHQARRPQEGAGKRPRAPALTRKPGQLTGDWICFLPNPKSQIPNPKSQIPNPKS
jgi:hypothetical protein